LPDGDYDENFSKSRWLSKKMLTAAGGLYAGNSIRGPGIKLMKNFLSPYGSRGKSLAAVGSFAAA
jgi:hypothetical protein